MASVRTIWKVFFTLCIVMYLYLCFGAYIFRSLESGNEVEAQEMLYASLIEFVNERPCLTNESMTDFFDALERALGMSVVGITRNPIKRDKSVMWDIPTSFFFTTTLLTTIGYGNFAPTTKFGQLFCSLYSLLGIPIAAWFFIAVGDVLRGCWQTIRVRTHAMTAKIKSMRARHFVHFIVYSILINVIILLIPATVFMYTEDWEFSDSLYYCFITLSTIGFGDMVAGDRQMHTSWYWIQNIALVVWILVALSTVSMALTVLAKSSQKTGSKRAKSMARKFAIRSSARTERGMNKSERTTAIRQKSSPSKHVVTAKKVKLAHEVTKPSETCVIQEAKV